MIKSAANPEAHYDLAAAQMKDRHSFSFHDKKGHAGKRTLVAEDRVDTEP